MVKLSYHKKKGPHIIGTTFILILILAFNIYLLKSQEHFNAIESTSEGFTGKIIPTDTVRVSIYRPKSIAIYHPSLKDTIPADTLAASVAIEAPFEEVAKTESIMNYEGYIGNYKIQLHLEFNEPKLSISGYYYYDSYKTKIPVSGNYDGEGNLNLRTINGNIEYFSGQRNFANLDECQGTWSCNGKQLQFKFEKK